MRPSITIFLSLCAAYAASAAPFESSASSSSAVSGFKRISEQTGLLYLQQSEPKTFTWKDVEQVLFNISKTIDATSKACKTTHSLDEEQKAATLTYVNATAESVVKGTTVIQRNVDAIRSRNETETDTTILLTLASGYDKVFHSCQSIFPEDIVNFVAALFSTIICDLNDAAQALTPGSQLVDADYCDTYKPAHKKAKHPHPSVHPKPIRSSNRAHPEHSRPHPPAAHLKASNVHGHPSNSTGKGESKEHHSPVASKPHAIHGVGNYTTSSQHCSVQGSGSLADVDVLNCSNISILSGDRPSLDDLRNAPDYPFPQMPKSFSKFDDCDGQCSDVMKFAYQNHIWSDTRSRFCSPTKMQPVWKPCSSDWQPVSWISDSKKSQPLPL